MSSDLVAVAIATVLGTSVVIMGLRRGLSETTRRWLPRFGEDSEQATATAGGNGEKRGRRPLSLRQRRWLASLYLLVALIQAASAVLGSEERMLHAATAAVVLLGVAVLLLRRPAQPSVDPS